LLKAHSVIANGPTLSVYRIIFSSVPLDSSICSYTQHIYFVLFHNILIEYFSQTAIVALLYL